MKKIFYYLLEFHKYYSIISSMSEGATRGSIVFFDFLLIIDSYHRISAAAKHLCLHK